MLAVTNHVQSALRQRCDAWHLQLDKMSFERNAGPDAKTNALQAVCSTYANQLGALQAAVQAHLQWLDRLQQQQGNRFGEINLTLESRLLLHLGAPTSSKTSGSIAIHTTGLPLIPGSAVKGILSTWACWAEHFNPAEGSFRGFTESSRQRRHFAAEEAQLARRILGDNSATGSEHAGDVIFIGGFPLTPPKLGLDIVNPHYDEETDRQTRQIHVRDKTRLTPNTFLCIEPGTIWRFVFYVRPGAADAGKLLETTTRWMVEALTQLGIGAKTAAGYRRFREPVSTDLEAQKKREAEAKAAETAAARQAQQQAVRAAQLAAAQLTLKSDYPNEASFRNRVLNKLDPGRLEQLRSEIEVLQKPQNKAQREELKKQLASKTYKDIRKRLRNKDWFPKEWLPQ